MQATKALGHDPKFGGHDAEFAGHDPETGGHDRPKYAVYVLVIGESLRSDFLFECGGPARMRRLPADSLVACDVTAGSDATHTSVPLLVSRDLPGQPVRVPRDATFQRAFAETGFRTFWFGVQERAVVWPDAAVQRYPGGSDRAALLPLLDQALSSNTGRASIVLHTYGAHEPYCSRFQPERAPFEDACNLLGDLPTRSSISSWRMMYANAVDDSVDLLNGIVERFAHWPGPVFLVFTPDHGENLLDDDRALFGHAMRRPTRWDIRVPAVFWANPVWRELHPHAWARLARNVQTPLTHADIVPTLLSAAGISYSEQRTAVVDLLARDVPARRRFAQMGLGEVIDWQQLVDEAVSR